MAIDLWVEAWTAAMPSIDFEARRVWFAARCTDHRRDGAQLMVCRTAETPLAAFAMVLPRTHTLDQLAVAPAFQGLGLARALIETAKRLCPGGLDLDVNTGNIRALRLYEACGFKVTGAGTNPLSGLSILRMTWSP